MDYSVFSDAILKVWKMEKRHWQMVESQKTKQIIKQFPIVACNIFHEIIS